jgi:hypothetical protein
LKNTLPGVRQAKDTNTQSDWKYASRVIGGVEGHICCKNSLALKALLGALDA